MRVGRALDEIGAWTASAGVWERVLGDEFSDVQPLLSPEPELATVIRLPGRKEYLPVVSHGDNDHVAVDPDNPNAIRVHRDDLILWTLPCELFLQQTMLAASLASRLDIIPGATTLWRLGELRKDRKRLPVYASVALTPRTLAADVSLIRQLSSEWFIAITLAHELPPLSSQIIQSRGAAWVSMDDAFAWQSPGVLWCPEPFTELLPDPMRQRQATAIAPKSRSSIPIADGTKWSDVEMRPSATDAIEVKIDSVIESLTPAKLGLLDGRNGKPNKAWNELGHLLAKQGTIKIPTTAGSKRQRQIEELRKALKAYFPIPGNPINWSHSRVTAGFNCISISNDD